MTSFVFLLVLFLIPTILKLSGSRLQTCRHCDGSGLDPFVNAVYYIMMPMMAFVVLYFLIIKKKVTFDNKLKIIKEEKTSFGKMKAIKFSVISMTKF
ncbi:hypothetical protein K0B03_04550 [Patescibacteria group bacterium]|nr:hypothetical protein [Patescibacteria group bacterium]